MIRTGILRVASTQLKSRAKKGRCKQCRQSFDVKGNSLIDRFCNLDCAVAYGLAKKEKVAKKKLVAQRKELKARKEKLKTKSDYLREVRTVVHKYVRLRDQDKLCICCDKPLGDREVGGAFDAGHYRSVGSAPHLRFDIRNIHAQRKYCNNWRAGRAVEYRIGLIKRRGIEVVEALESDNTPRHWDIEYLKRLKAIFTKKARRLEKRLGIR